MTRRIGILEQAVANIHRYSMPGAGIYDRVTGLLFRARYAEIADDVATVSSRPAFGFAAVVMAVMIMEY